MPRVFNIRTGVWPKGARTVDRRTPFGNPFRIGPDGNREQVIEKYRKWIWESEQYDLRAQMRKELRGKDLLCWCAPEVCHADVILQIANYR